MWHIGSASLFAVLFRLVYLPSVPIRWFDIRNLNKKLAHILRFPLQVPKYYTNCIFTLRKRRMLS